jgi:hypothetical protein
MGELRLYWRFPSPKLVLARRSVQQPNPQLPPGGVGGGGGIGGGATPNSVSLHVNVMPLEHHMHPERDRHSIQLDTSDGSRAVEPATREAPRFSQLEVPNIHCPPDDHAES